MLNTDDPLSPRHAEPAQAPLRSRTRVRAAQSVITPPEPEEPPVEIVEAGGLRWINIERPRAGRPRVAGGALRLPPARLRGRLLAQPAPEDRRVRRVPVHRAPLPALRQDGRAPQRGRARPVRRAGLPHHPAERADRPGRVPVRALPHGAGAARAVLLQGRGLPPLQDRRRRRRCLVSHAAQDGQQAGAHRGRGLRGQRPRSCGTSPTSSRRSSTSARSSARSARCSATWNATRRATSPTTSTSTSTTSSTRRSASGRCSRATRRRWRRSRSPTSR